ncbi:MAG: NAD+ synthase [bacterium]|nr:NAD+ synthase [bacterium]
MKIALAQINPTVGDFRGNVRKILSFSRRAERAGASLCLFPEMAVTGYPARDLLLNTDFIDDNLRALDRIARGTGAMPIVVGFAARSRSATGRGLFNAGALVRRGKVRQVFRKMLLPTYDVFDETRYFDPADRVSVARIGRARIGLTICEDIWNAPDLWRQRFYAADPVELLMRRGVDAVVNIAASPFALGRRALRRRILRGVVSRAGVPVYFVNQVGGNDQLIFDGCSLALDARGEPTGRGRAFGEDLVVADPRAPLPAAREREEPCEETVLRALVLGVADYARKCGFAEAVIGLSGGIDSAVTACIAAKALGPRRVHGVAMPSPYTSRASVEDARALARNLGLRFSVIPISGLYRAHLRTLRPLFRGRREDETEENVQARIRGTILMALSNKFGWLVISTGNKSEVAVGYCTLYGDMTGGLAALSDVPKTLVWRLARSINRRGEVIPSRTIERPPSAELRPGQTDADSLPPYELLDGVLGRYVERRERPEEIIAAGYDRALVCDIVRRVERNEYKREQAPPGLRITTKAFGHGRRMPIAQRYH